MVLLFESSAETIHAVVPKDGEGHEPETVRGQTVVVWVKIQHYLGFQYSGRHSGFLFGSCALCAKPIVPKSPCCCGNYLHDHCRARFIVTAGDEELATSSSSSSSSSPAASHIHLVCPACITFIRRPATVLDIVPQDGGLTLIRMSGKVLRHFASDAIPSFMFLRRIARAELSVYDGLDDREPDATECRVATDGIPYPFSSFARHYHTKEAAIHMWELAGQRTFDQVELTWGPVLVPDAASYEAMLEENKLVCLSGAPKDGSLQRLLVPSHQWPHEPDAPGAPWVHLVTTDVGFRVQEHRGDAHEVAAMAYFLPSPPERTAADYNFDSRFATQHSEGVQDSANDYRRGHPLSQTGQQLAFELWRSKVFWATCWVPSLDLPTSAFLKDMERCSRDLSQLHGHLLQCSNGTSFVFMCFSEKNHLYLHEMLEPLGMCSHDGKLMWFRANFCRLLLRRWFSDQPRKKPIPRYFRHPAAFLEDDDETLAAGLEQQEDDDVDVTSVAYRYHGPPGRERNFNFGKRVIDLW